jgi:hypothetical protein
VSYTLGSCDVQGRYRYSLQVISAERSPRRLIVIQCNPSVATSQRADPTVGKVARWAVEHGFGETVFLNLFARISPYPDELLGLRYAQLVGPRNDATIAAQLGRPGSTLVLAWGGRLPVDSRRYARRVAEVRGLVTAAGVEAFHVGALTANRYPRHGRMWNRGNRDLRRLAWSSLELLG